LSLRPVRHEWGTHYRVNDLPYDCKVVVLVDEVTKEHEGRLHVPGMVAALILSALAIILFYLGWILPSPGGSLVVPTLVVFGIGCIAGLACWIATGSRAIPITAAGIALVASVWTFQFSLPASVTWGSNATAQAQEALVRVNLGPYSAVGIPVHPCSIAMTGSVGKLDAPYRQCAASTPQGHFVTFTPKGQPTHGLAYTDVGAGTFPDECSRHLIGEWWMFSGSTDGMGGCPIGYQFHGGG